MNWTEKELTTRFGLLNDLVIRVSRLERRCEDLEKKVAELEARKPFGSVNPLI